MTTNYTVYDNLAPPAACAEWCAAFVKAQAQLVNPPKTEKVTTGKFSYTYASLPDIIDSVRQVLFDNGLSFTQSITSDDARIGCTTTLYHSAGHSETFGPLFMPAGSTPQEYGSAITYARRYALCAVLGIAADEDDDGAKASKRASSERTSSARSGAKPDATRATGKGFVASGTTSNIDWCGRRGCGHSLSVHPDKGACQGINGSHNDPDGGEWPCKCAAFVATTSSAGEARAGVEGDKPRSLPAEDPNPAEVPTVRDPAGASAGAPCLHLHGSRTVQRAKGGTVEICIDCSRPIETVSA